MARIASDPGPNAQTIGNEIVVAPNGDLFNMVTFIPVHAANCNPAPALLFVAVIRSTDKGVTWSKPVVVNSLGTIGIRDPKTGEPVRTGDIIPQMSVDRETGVLYVVWQDARFSGGQRDGIAISRSTDNGQTWSAPIQVNKASNVQAFTASLNVTEDGTVGVTFYDFRNDNADPAVLLTTRWLALSRDGGPDVAREAGSRPIRYADTPVARGFFVGDYEGLGVHEDTLLPFFVMANSGNLANRTDVLAAVQGEDEDGSNNNRQEVIDPQSIAERVTAHREIHRGKLIRVATKASLSAAPAGVLPRRRFQLRLVVSGSGT